MVIFNVLPLVVTLVAGIAGLRWSMLYISAASLSAAVVEIFRTRRNSPFGACGILMAPCHVPGKDWANNTLAEEIASARIHSIFFIFMANLRRASKDRSG